MKKENKIIVSEEYGIQNGIKIGMKYKPQKEGVITIKDEKGVLVAILYKDGPSLPVTYLTEPAGLDEIVELMGCTLNQTQ